jgi:hypothetical protein
VCGYSYIKNREAINLNSEKFFPRKKLQLIYDIWHYNLLGVGDAGQGVLLLALRTLKTSGGEEAGHA